MDEMLPAISASDQRRLVAAYGGSTSFQYEPYVMHLRRLVEHSSPSWRFHALAFTRCGAAVREQIDELLRPGDLVVWIGPFCNPDVRWTDLRLRHPEVHRV